MLSALILVLGGGLVASGPAQATLAGPFNIDGTVPDDASFTALVDGYGSLKELGPLNSNTTKIGVIHSDAVPTLGLTNPNAQVDLRQAWLRTAKDATTHHDWLYFAWERDSNSGSGFIGYEFMHDAAPAACDYSLSDAALINACNPWANRRGDIAPNGDPQDPDFMILWDQQGGSTDLYLRVWHGKAPNLTLGAPQLLDASVSAAAYSTDKFRGEAAVDLTATVLRGNTGCVSLANTIPSTVTGNSDTADYKDTILTTVPPITNCSSMTVTTPKQSDGTTSIPASGVSIGTGVVGVKDSAVVSLTGGSATPAGSVSFTLCKVDAPGLCSPTTAGTSVGSTDLTGATYPATVTSPTAYVTSTGRYCWRATFSGDNVNGIPTSSDYSSGECFTVNPVTPALSTTAGAGVNLGTAVTDSAVLGSTASQPANPVINLTGTAGAAAGGTITFTLYGPNNCTSVAYTSSAVTVSGNGTYNTPAPQFVPTSAGTYHWVASYSGSSPNTNATTHNASCTDSSEDVTVTSVASSMTTAQKWVPNDSATISAPAGGNLVGTATFTLYPTANCSGTPVYGPVNRTVGGGSSVTVGTANTTEITAASGSYSWKVSYTSTNAAQRSIPDSCQETSALTITNGGTVSSP